MSGLLMLMLWWKASSMQNQRNSVESVNIQTLSFRAYTIGKCQCLLYTRVAKQLPIHLLRTPKKISHQISLHSKGAVIFKVKLILSNYNCVYSPSIYLLKYLLEVKSNFKKRFFNLSKSMSFPNGCCFKYNY